jgi:hypothetical protein
MIQRKRRGARRHKQLLNELKENRRYWKLKEVTLDSTPRRICLNKVYGSVSRQTVQCTNVLCFMFLLLLLSFMYQKITLKNLIYTQVSHFSAILQYFNEQNSFAPSPQTPRFVRNLTTLSTEWFRSSYWATYSKVLGLLRPRMHTQTRSN